MAAASSAFGMPSLAQNASTSSTWRAEMLEIKLAALAPGEGGALLTEVSSCERRAGTTRRRPVHSPGQLCARVGLCVARAPGGQPL